MTTRTTKTVRVRRTKKKAASKSAKKKTPAAKKTKKKPAAGKKVPPYVPPKLSPPKVERIQVTLIGTAPLVQRPIAVRHRPGVTFFQSAEGWNGIPTFGIRTALNGAFRLEGRRRGVKWLGGQISVVPDGFATLEHAPLSRITKGTPVDAGEVVGEKLAGGRYYDAGWEAEVWIAYDAGVFGLPAIRALLDRAGEDVGIGLLRPDAHRARTKEPDYSYGTFEVDLGELAPYAEDLDDLDL